MVDAVQVQPPLPRSHAAAVARAVIERMESEPVVTDREPESEPPPPAAE
jgi:hypothetical protein